VCVSVAPAEFSGTILYVGRHVHPEHGPVEVLGYQNTAVNRAQGPNAMLLHLPAAGMTRDNFLDAGDTPYVLRDLVDTLNRPLLTSRAAPVAAGVPRGVEVFDLDVYTVVLASDPRDVPAALSRVPEAKRPVLAPELFDFYARTYPGYPVALCCFDNADARRAAPLLLWYRPLFADRLTAPALDAHTGAAPDPDGWVVPDHWVVLGHADAPEGWGVPVRYRRDPGALTPFLPARVIGREVSGGKVRNGDFVISVADVRAGRIDGLARLTTTGDQVPLTEPSRSADPESTDADPESTEAEKAARGWVRPVLFTVAVVALTLFCGWFLIYGP
jgi:hypothetical protein